ncbi:pickpocket protein 28-like [Contarinia nasturtii]|uniref:pickpocket protein 28-like n=1 Tax=Contarinia nasturtii TaxID=265458 RepID=UPI0012D3E2AA|nr:pickpocket protein 28-like [Contarinia nasturtii]
MKRLIVDFFRNFKESVVNKAQTTAHFTTQCKQSVQIKLIAPSSYVLRKFFKQFGNNSSIHGVRYFTNKTLHWSERLWWIIGFVFTLWLCGLMIRDGWNYWNENPMTVKVGKRTQVSAIPFPAITICPLVKVLKHDLDRINAHMYMKESSSIEATQLSTLALFCPTLYRKYKSNVEFANESMYRMIEDLAPNQDYVIHSCRWQQNKVNCLEYISPVITDEGFCFTFNPLNSYDMYTEEVDAAMKRVTNIPKMSAWSLDNGYEVNSNGSEYPLRMFGSGQNNNLNMILSSDKQDNDFMCDSGQEGYIVMLDMPGESATRTQERIRFIAPQSESIKIRIEPKLTDTSNGLSNYKPAHRQCFYQSERQLRFFKIYTKYNCNMECIANFIQMECGCVKFNMPRDKNTKICGVKLRKCYGNAQFSFQGRTGRLFRAKCNCMEACTEIEYDLKIDQEPLFDENGGKGNYTRPQKTKLSIYFEDQTIETLTRVETYTYTDFLAICGGLLGLFLGISFLSIIEIVYYATLRVFWDIHLSRPETIEKSFNEKPFGENQMSENRVLFKVVSQPLPSVAYISQRTLHG